MRDTPRHIARALRKRHQRLGMVWDQASHSWWFTFCGVRQWQYRHSDGLVCDGDPVEGEVMAIVREADRFNRAGDHVRELDRAMDRMRDASGREDSRVLADAGSEFLARARFAGGGTRPHVRMGA